MTNKRTILKWLASQSSEVLCPAYAMGSLLSNNRWLEKHKKCKDPDTLITYMTKNVRDCLENTLKSDDPVEIAVIYIIIYGHLPELIRYMRKRSVILRKRNMILHNYRAKTIYNVLIGHKLRIKSEHKLNTVIKYNKSQIHVIYLLLLSKIMKTTNKSAILKAFQLLSIAGIYIDIDYSKKNTNGHIIHRIITPNIVGHKNFKHIVNETYNIILEMPKEGGKWINLYSE